MAGERMQPWIDRVSARRSRVEARAAHGPSFRVLPGGFGDPRTARLVALGAVLASGAAGAIATQPRALVLSLAALGVALAALLAVRAPGVLLGILLLLVANAIPGADVSDAYAPGGLPIQDIGILLIIGLLAQRVIAGEPERLRRPWVRPAAGWGCVLAAWWILTWLRSIDGEGISPLNAALFGRDFLYFALLVPLALAGLNRSDLAGLAAAVVVGGMVAAVGQIGTVLAGGELSFLINVYFVKSEGGIPRVYSGANDLVILLVPLGLGLILLGRSAALRRAGVVVAAIAGLATLLMQTRAIYATLPIAILAVSAILMTRSSPVGSALRRGAKRVAVVTVISLTGLVLIAPEIFTSSTFGQVTERALSGLSGAAEETGTVAYRQQLGSTLLELLGAKWPIGLGFLHPNDYYVAGVPFGTIRNSDLGVLEAIMPMGALGALLLYLPPIAAVCSLVRRLGSARQLGRFAWLAYGATAWILSVLLGSITLVTLFVPGGVTYIALLIATAFVALPESSTGAE